MYHNPSNPDVCRYIDRIADPFIAYSHHQNRRQFGGELQSIFAGHPQMDAYNQLCFGEALTIVIERCLGTHDRLTRTFRKINDDEPQHRPDREEKLTLILEAVSHTPTLFAEVNRGITNATRRVEESGYSDLRISPGDLTGFQTFKRYPDLKCALD